MTISQNKEQVPYTYMLSERKDSGSSMVHSSIKIAAALTADDVEASSENQSKRFGNFNMEFKLLEFVGFRN